MTELTYLSVDKLHPHPDNPRKDLGDLTELTDSIKANGVFQNLTVVPEGDGYTIIIGHRRCAAAKAAGLTEVPRIVTEMSEREQLQTMLLASVIVSVIGLYELTLIERHERREAEAARRSAYREAFFRAMEEDRP